MVPSPGSTGVVVPGHGRRERSRTGLNGGVHAAKACWGDLRQLVGCRRFRHAHRVKACLELSPALRAGRGPCGVERQGHRGVCRVVHRPDQGRPELRHSGRASGGGTAGGRTRARPAAGGPDPGQQDPSPQGAASRLSRPVEDQGAVRVRSRPVGIAAARRRQGRELAAVAPGEHPAAEQLYLEYTEEEE
jgi:hypothetical protein